jgi:hypothetical protein
MELKYISLSWWTLHLANWIQSTFSRHISLNPITFPTVPCFPLGLYLQHFWLKFRVHFYLPYMCHISRPLHPINVWWRVPILKLMMQFSPGSCAYFVISLFHLIYIRWDTLGRRSVHGKISPCNYRMTKRNVDTYPCPRWNSITWSQFLSVNYHDLF